MSEYGHYEGVDGAGAEPAADDETRYADSADPGMHFGDLFDLGAQPGAEPVDTDPAGNADADVPDLAGPFDGLDLDRVDLDLADLDLADLGGADLDLADLGTDLTFDASYDLLGADPDESGWWTDLTSDHNHDAAYDTGSDAIDLNPYVAR